MHVFMHGGSARGELLTIDAIPFSIRYLGQVWLDRIQWRDDSS